jgi:hypothetical protein
LNFDLNRLLALAIVYPHTKVDEYALRNVRFRVGTRLLRIQQWRAALLYPLHNFVSRGELAL